MATIVSTRINRLQAVSPRSSTVPVGLGTVIDYRTLTNTPALGDLASKDHITESELVGGLSTGKITGLGALALLDKLDLGTGTTGSLSASNVTGLGALALLNKINLGTDTTGTINGSTQVTNLGSLAYADSIAANQIGAGTLAAGVVYAGSVAADKIGAGTLNAGVIYSGSVAADKIGAGTLNAGVIYSGSISADKITAGTMQAANVTFSAGGHTLQWGKFSGSAGIALKVTTASTSDWALWSDTGSVAAKALLSWQDTVVGRDLSVSGNATVAGTITGTASRATTADGVSNAAGAVLKCRNYKAAMQDDGNFVVVGVSLWSSATNVSDARMKENIVPTTRVGIDVIESLSVVDFTWKQTSGLYDGGKVQTGFLAHSVADVIPSAVHSVTLPSDVAERLAASSMLFLHKEEIVPFLVKAVQELSARVTALEAK